MSGLYRGYIWMMETKMESTILGLGFWAPSEKLSGGLLGDEGI